MEIVQDLTAETFLLAFQTFAGQRSLPKIMISDNGSTYMSAAEELRKLMELTEVKEELGRRIPLSKESQVMENLISTQVKVWSQKSPKNLKRYKFNSRTQKTRESITTFVAKLRRLAKHCKFGRTLDGVLRDRLVCRITNSCVQRRLLAEPDLTLQTGSSSGNQPAAAATERHSVLPVWGKAFNCYLLI